MYAVVRHIDNKLGQSKTKCSEKKNHLIQREEPVGLKSLERTCSKTHFELFRYNCNSTT